MATKRRAKRVTSRAAGTEREDLQNPPERTTESLSEIVAASGAQAVRFAAAVARGMAKGVASAARELRRPVGEVTEVATETVRNRPDFASKAVEHPTKTRRRPTSTRGRKSGSSKRRSA